MSRRDHRVEDFYSTKWPAMEPPKEFTRRARAKKVLKALWILTVTGAVIWMIVYAALNQAPR